MAGIHGTTLQARNSVESWAVSRIHWRCYRVAQYIGVILIVASHMVSAAASGASTPVPSPQITLPSSNPDTPFKLATFEFEGRTTVGMVIGTRLLDIADANEQLVDLVGLPALDMPLDMRELIERYEELAPRLYQIANHHGGPSDTEFGVAVDAVSIKAPIKYPWNLLAAAANYRAHAVGMATHTREPVQQAQAGRPPVGFDPSIISRLDLDRDGPVLFAKSPRSTIIDPGEPFYIEPGRRIDWEGELAVVIGKRAFGISLQDAREHVFGYSILYDVSDRGGEPPRRSVSMFPGPNWFDGKSIDRGAPFGPYIVPKEFLADPARLRIVTRVNGVVRQDGNTRDLLWDERRLVRFAASIMTLYPGDVIATGTPAGTGAESNEFLSPGDVVEIEIEGIGTLRTPLKASSERR